MLEHCDENDEPKDAMAFTCGKSIRTLQVCPIKKDGNYSTIAHQLNSIIPCSEAHVQLSITLRASVANYIAQKLSSFEFDLRDRVYTHSPNQRIHDVAEEIIFVETRLSKEGVWGGMETPKAVREINRVNILIIEENGGFYSIGDYDDSFGIVLLAYRYS